MLPGGAQGEETRQLCALHHWLAFNGQRRGTTFLCPSFFFFNPESCHRSIRVLCWAHSPHHGLSLTLPATFAVAFTRWFLIGPGFWNPKDLTRRRAPPQCGGSAASPKRDLRSRRVGSCWCWRLLVDYHNRLWWMSRCSWYDVEDPWTTLIFKAFILGRTASLVCRLVSGQYIMSFWGWWPNLSLWVVAAVNQLESFWGNEYGRLFLAVVLCFWRGVSPVISWLCGTIGQIKCVCTYVNGNIHFWATNVHFIGGIVFVLGRSLARVGRFNDENLLHLNLLQGY